MSLESTNYLSATTEENINQINNITNSEKEDETKYNDSENNEEKSNEEESNEEESNEEDSNEESNDEDNNIQNFLLKSETNIFVLSVDGVPQFYTKTLKDAREQMWHFAKLQRIKEVQYNTYIRGCPNKNRIEVIGCNKFSVFFVDRVICRLCISEVQEIEIPSSEEIYKDAENNEPVSTPEIPPPTKSFIWSFFGW